MAIPVLVFPGFSAGDLDYNEHCEHIEVDASHLSLGFDPRVLQLVSRAVEESHSPELFGLSAS